MRGVRSGLGGVSDEAVETTQILGSALLLLMSSGSQPSPWPTRLLDGAVCTAWHGVRTARASAEPVPAFLWMVSCEDEAAFSAETSELSVWRGISLGGVVPGSAATDLLAQGLLINMMSVTEADEEELNAWYDTEHVPRIASVPGVLAARRYRASVGRPHYAALYLLSDASPPTTATWQVAATTPWTQSIQRIRTDSARYLFDRRIEPFGT